MTASAENQYARRLNNESNHGIWQTWANIPFPDGIRRRIIAEKPEWITLAWPHPETLTGLGLLWAGFGAANIQIYEGPVERHPREAAEADWKSIKDVRGFKNQYLPGARDKLD
jgi:hypothetical protein